MDVYLQELDEKLVQENDYIKKMAIYRNELMGVKQELTETKQQLDEVNQKLQKLSYYDELTGIPNRRYFYETLDVELRRLKRDKEPISIVMLEIDNFKRYSDNYGHLSADECLIKISRIISSKLLRASDFVARFERDVFMIVLPNTDAAGAFDVGEKLRKAVISNQIPNVIADLPEGIVTVSAGTGTVIPYYSLTIEDFIYNADKALNESRIKGGNQVTKGIIMY